LGGHERFNEGGRKHGPRFRTCGWKCIESDAVAWDVDSMAEPKYQIENCGGWEGRHGGRWSSAAPSVLNDVALTNKGIWVWVL